MNSELVRLTAVSTGRNLRDHPNYLCIAVKELCVWQQNENQEKLSLEFYFFENVFRQLKFYNIIEGVY